MGSSHEKNRGRKSCDTAPLMQVLLMVWGHLCGLCGSGLCCYCLCCCWEVEVGAFAVSTTAVCASGAMRTVPVGVASVYVVLH